MAILAYDDVVLREPRLLRPGMSPLGLAKIDWTHPLARGLAVYVLPKQGDLVSNTRMSWGSTGKLAPKSGNFSIETDDSNNDCGFLVLPADSPLYKIAGSHTTMLNLEHTASANYANFVSVPWAAGSWNPPYNSLVLYKHSAASNVWQYQITFTTGTVLLLVNSATAVATTDKSIIASYNGAASGKMYVNGVDVSSGATASNEPINWNTKQPLCILAASNSYAVNAGVTGNAFSVAIWNRQLTAAESREMYLNPYQFLIPA